MKKRTIRMLLCALLAFAVLLPAAGAEGILSMDDALALVGQGAQMDLQVIPQEEDLSGYTIRIRADRTDVIADGIAAAPVPDGEDGMCRADMTEDEVRLLLDRGQLLSIGPDGAAFFFAGVPAVLRGKTVTVLVQAKDRGEPDTYGRLAETLEFKMIRQPDYVNGNTRWSPDGRYIFMNEPDKWLGAMMRDEDPYLADTVTGEIFLLETSPKRTAESEPFRRIVGGRFSRDGRSFWYLIDDRDISSGIRGSLVRYDLETGARETVFESDKALRDLCEMGEGRWLLIENGEERSLVRLSVTETGASAERELLLQGGGTFVLYPVTEDLALLRANYSGYFSLLLPIRWEQTGPWLQIRDLETDELRRLTAEEAAEEIDAGKKYMYGSTTGPVVIYGSIPDFGTIASIKAIDGTPVVMMEIGAAFSVSSNWADRQRPVAALAFLDTETLRMRVARLGPWIGSINYIGDGDETLFGNRILDRSGTLYALAAAGEEDVFPADLGYATSPEGNYMLSRAGDVLLITPAGSYAAMLALPYTELDSTVAAEGGGYRITSVFTRFPEPEQRIYLIPEAIGQERFRALMEEVSKKDKKVASAFYTLVEPEKLAKKENAEELLAAYPGLADEAMYVLKEGQRTHDLERLETIFSSAGYTEYDYEMDARNVAAARGTNAVTVTDQEAPKARNYIAYTVPGVANDPAFGTDLALQLAGLCDRINSAVFYGYLRPEGEASPVPSLIGEEYEIGGAVWRVTLDSAEDDGGKLALSLTAEPVK